MYFRYRFGVFAGISTNGQVRGKVQICGLMACVNDSLSSCGERFDEVDTFKPWVSFDKLEISQLSFRKENVSKLNLPVSLKTNFRPLNPRDFVLKSIPIIDSEYDFVSLALEEPQEDLMTFGIYGRIYWAEAGK